MCQAGCVRLGVCLLVLPFCVYRWSAQSIYRYRCSFVLTSPPVLKHTSDVQSRTSRPSVPSPARDLTRQRPPDATSRAATPPFIQRPQKHTSTPFLPLLHHRHHPSHPSAVSHLLHRVTSCTGHDSAPEHRSRDRGRPSRASDTSRRSVGARRWYRTPRGVGTMTSPRHELVAPRYSAR